MEIVKSLEFRSNFRNKILNLFENREIFLFHPNVSNYTFSNTGKVKNIITNKFLKPFLNKDGYQMINIVFTSGKRQCIMLHRMIMECFNPYLGINNYFYEVNHIDCNKVNNNISNLEWMTRQENLEHARKNRLFKSMINENNGNCKIQNKEIQDLKDFHDLGFSIKEISQAYNLNRNWTSKLINGKVRNNV